MFRLEGFCDDKHVVAIMKSLTGVVMDFKMVPVVNAAAKNGKLVAKTSGDPLDMLVDFVKKNKMQEISAVEIKKFCVSLGKVDSYCNYLIKQAKDARLLKRKAGTPNNKAIYRVLK